jgi:hypothetical protein
MHSRGPRLGLRITVCAISRYCRAISMLMCSLGSSGPWSSSPQLELDSVVRARELAALHVAIGRDSWPVLARSRLWSSSTDSPRGGVPSLLMAGIFPCARAIFLTRRSISSG